MSPHHSPVRVALVGAHGFGTVHLENLRRLTGRVTLVGVVDPVAPDPSTLPGEPVVTTTLPDLFDRVDDIDVVIVATPLHTHAQLAQLVVARGIDLYLEKPPVVRLADHHRLAETAARTGSVIQVGFQSLGSHALRAFDRDDFDLGPIVAVGAVGTWLRPQSYWERSSWAGRRTLGGLDVMDGVSLNPLAHASATALRVLGATRAADVSEVTADLYRANAIEGDDTSVLRVTTTAGVRMTAALTLCAPIETLPTLRIRGSRREAVYSYVDDTVTVGDEVHRFERTDLFENLLDHRSTGAALLSSLDDAEAFSVLAETVSVTPTLPIEAPYVEHEGEGGARHAVVTDIAHWIEKAVDAQATFAELHAPWTSPPNSAPLASLTHGGALLGELRSGSDVTSTSSPRPYLHPLTTPAGVVVTAHHPEDHDWHLGLGIAIQDVDGVNFWGGRTYVTDLGYVWRTDHGRIEPTNVTLTDDALDCTLVWRGPEGAPMLHEERRMRWTRRSPDAWVIDLDTILRPALMRTVTLGSPGSNGRVGGGYGGLFWRLPASDDVEVRTPDARGESAVHGSTGAWLAWSARYAGGEATVAITPRDAATVADPWFVRSGAYPGIGQSLAWDQRVSVTPDAPLVRSWRLLVADGRQGDGAVTELLG